MKDNNSNGAHLSELSVVGLNMVKTDPNPYLARIFADKDKFLADANIGFHSIVEAYELRLGKCTNPRILRERLVEHNYRTNGRRTYMRNLLKGSSPFILDYSDNVLNVLKAEKKLFNKKLSILERNEVRNQIFCLQTFERAKEIIALFGNNDPARSVIYTDFSVAYAMHLLYGCQFFHDSPDNFEDQRSKIIESKQNLLSYYSFFENKQKPLWHSGLNPNISGDWGRNSEFDLFLLKTSFENKTQGIISDTNGMQYFEGQLDNEGLEIKCQYIVNVGERQTQFGFYPFPIKNKRLNFDKKSGESIGEESKVGFFSLKKVLV